MGGGAAMRAAAKVAGIGLVNSGIRGGLSSASSPAEQSVRNVKRPVSAIISSSASASQNKVEIEGIQRPAFEIDDWEIEDFESLGDHLHHHQQLVESNEPLPRVVFGPPPSLEEAKAATNEVKDALEKVYLSSSASHNGSSGLLGGSQFSETKSSISCDTAKPRYAIQAFTLLNQSPEAQSVVASIATDPDVWNAVFKNEALQEYLLCQKTNDLGSPRVSDASSDDASEAEKVKNDRIDILDSIKHAVADMVNTVSTFVQQIFGYSPAENISASADAKAQSSIFDNKTLGASFMALAVMVIMVVVLKRG